MKEGYGMKMMLKKIAEHVFYTMCVLGAFAIIGLLTDFIDGI